MLCFLTRSDKKDIVGRNICKIYTKVLIWNVNQQGVCIKNSLVGGQI